MKKQLAWIYAWWAGFMVLVFSLIVLGLCTFFEVKNPSLTEIWKYTLSSSIGYVIGLPIGTAFSKESLK
jgi:uncharacterized protein YybS (DUF2232 family)